VLGGVGEGLGDHEVGGRLDRAGQALGDDLHADRDGRAGGQCGDRRVQPPVDQHRRVDAARQVAQVGEGALGLFVRLADQLGGRLRVGAELLPGHAEVHGEGDQALLGAVVEVALDAAALVLGRVHRPVAAGLQGVDPGAQLRLAGAEQAPGDGGVGGAHATGGPGGDEAQQQADHGGGQGLRQGVQHHVGAVAEPDRLDAAARQQAVVDRHRQQGERGAPQGHGDDEPGHPEGEQQHQVGEVLPGGGVGGHRKPARQQAAGRRRPVRVGDAGAEREADPAALQPGAAPPGHHGERQDRQADPDDHQGGAHRDAADQRHEPEDPDGHARHQVGGGRPGPRLDGRPQRPLRPGDAGPAGRGLLHRHRTLLGSPG
jgi:hypothetical protein